MGSFAFFINLQLCPVYITIPNTHLVFFNFAPFNKSCFASKGISCFFSPLSLSLLFIVIIFVLKDNSIFPFNWYKNGLGQSEETLPEISNFLIFSLFSLNWPFVSLRASFCFKVFSPSSVPVSIKQIPPSNSDSINIKSAGKVFSCNTSTISPTYKVPLVVFSHWPLR